MMRVRMAQVAAFLLLAAPLHGQEISVTTDSFASIPWTASEETIRAERGEPVREHQVPETKFKVLLYEGIPFDSIRVAVTVLAVHEELGLVIGLFFAVVRDSATLELAMSDWTARVTSRFGEPASYCSACGVTLLESEWSIGGMSDSNCHLCLFFMAATPPEPRTPYAGMLMLTAGLGELLESSVAPEELEPVSSAMSADAIEYLYVLSTRE